MKRRPITLNGKLFDFASAIQISAYSLFMTVTTVIAFSIGKTADEGCAVTMTFLTLSLTQLLHAYNMKSNLSIFKTDIKSNTFMNYSTVILAFLTMFIVLTPVGFAFNLSILSTGKFFISLGLAALIIPFGEVIKLFSKKIEA